MHMNAAKMVRTLSAKALACMKGRETTSGIFTVVGNNFMNTWLLYHEVLADFSAGICRTGKQPDMLSTLPDNTYQDTIVCALPKHQYY